ncbi:diguanylate cyclase [Planctomycetota bacterium]
MVHVASDRGQPMRVGIVENQAGCDRLRAVLESDDRVAVRCFPAAADGSPPPEAWFGASSLDVLLFPFEPGDDPSEISILCDRVDVPVVTYGGSLTGLAEASGGRGTADHLSVDDETATAVPLILLAVTASGSGSANVPVNGSRKELFETALAGVRQSLSRTRSELATDWLTGLHNRRYFDTRLAAESERASRNLVGIGLLLVDLDCFKEINDVHGHDLGDAVLQEVGRRIRAAVRSYDVPCRIGGDELAVILPATSLEQAHDVALRLHRRVKAEPVMLGARETTVTASIGVAASPGPEAQPGLELYRRADRALQLVKQNGKNAVGSVGADGVGNPLLDRVPEAARERFARLLTTIRELTDTASKEHVRTIESFVRLIQEDCEFSLGGSERVAGHATAIARHLGCSEEEVETIRHAAMIQDIGMAVVGPCPTSQETLTEEELALVHTHPICSQLLVCEVPQLSATLPLILDHHEHLDGSGYPRGLRGQRIPLGARILAVASALESVTSPAANGPGRLLEKALSQLREKSGTWYDPAVVDAACAVVQPTAELSKRADTTHA